ncbi:site-2 protease family protein [Marmoricola sp. RAF53]|uniref:site-2 protease family protein n=1 Tax=Marmoricola sp. RAF53 TaxID=3233059 RepID=UPI003F9B47A0
MAADQNRPPSHPPGSFRVGSIGGVDVYVKASWFLVAAMIAFLLAPRVEQVEPGLGPLKYVAGLAFAVLLYLSILFHEMSHALMARRFGLPVRSISLEFLGGSTEIETEPATPGQEFKVAVVGPLTSIALGIVALASLVVFREGLTRMAFEGLAAANLLLGVLNLVPGLPLDGGRVLRAAVWRISGNVHDGTVVAAWGGRVAALLALLWPAVARSVFDVQTTVVDYLFACIIAGFLWAGATASMTSAKIRRRLPALRARPLARRVVAVPEDLPTAEAVRRAQEAGAGGLLVLSSAGEATGIVSEAALTSTPEDRRAWVPVSTIARSLQDGLVLPADLSGEDLVRAMARTPASEYLLVEPDGAIYGLLATADVDAAFEAASRR